LRRQIDASLVDAVESGATTVMNDSDWTSIRTAARAAAPSKPRPRTTKRKK